jgi:hypothetical protein
VAANRKPRSAAAKQVARLPEECIEDPFGAGLYPFIE